MSTNTTSTGTVTSYRAAAPTGGDGFGRLLLAEWTKFRTVRGWVVGAAAAAVIMVLFGLVTAAGNRGPTAHGGGGAQRPGPLTGPGGEAVNDGFYFVHRPLAGDGTITARVTSLTGGAIPDGGAPGGGAGGGPPGDGSPGGGGTPATVGGVAAWSKAGLIVKESTTQGSAYAAVMVTGGHGVRMQYDYTGDIAGPAGTVSATSPRWLRLTRTGDTLTGYASVDGRAWTTLGRVRLAGLSSTVQAGLFVTSPDQVTYEQHLGGFGATGGPSLATAAFDSVDLGSGGDLGANGGRWPGGWSGLDIGGDPQRTDVGYRSSGGTFTVTGTGDIAPTVIDSGAEFDHLLSGAFASLTVLVVLAVLFVTAEYRRGMIRTTLAASPRRGRVLTAKAVVIGAVAFVTGLVAAAVTIPPGKYLLRSGGAGVYPTTWLTDLRVITGTAAVLAVAAVLALALGAILRRGAGAVATVIVLVVLPYLLATAAVLPVGPSRWLLRVTPAAAFAVQQIIPAYPQVSHAYTPAYGFYPLAPWAGFGVLCAYAAVALGVAAYLLRRRDA